MSNLSFFAGEYDGKAIRVTEDGLFSVVDVLRRVFWRKERSVNAHQMLKSISVKYPDVARECVKFKFPGRGQRETPVATQETCETILRLLGVHTEQVAVTSDKFYPRTESQIVSVLAQGFSDLQPIPQFVVHGYRIDLYLALANIAVEVDEYGHKAYSSKNEQERHRVIKSALGCSFVRFDPYAADFNLGSVIREIRGLI